MAAHRAELVVHEWPDMEDRDDRLRGLPLTQRSKLLQRLQWADGHTHLVYCSGRTYTLGILQWADIHTWFTALSSGTPMGACNTWGGCLHGG